MMARAKALMAAALLLGGAAACSDVTGNVNPEGQFILKTVDGVRIPYTYTDPSTGEQIYVQGDTYVLNSDGSYTENQAYQINGQQQSAFEIGYYTQSGNTIRFSPSQSDFDLVPYQGTVRNSGTFGGSRTLTISLNGTTAIYSD